MKVEDWIKLKEELIKSDIVAEVDLRFYNTCRYTDYDLDVRKWEEEVWIECPLGCVLDRKRINFLLDFRDKHNLDMEIYNGEHIRFTEKNE